MRALLADTVPSSVPSKYSPKEDGLMLLRDLLALLVGVLKRTVPPRRQYILIRSPLIALRIEPAPDEGAPPRQPWPIGCVRYAK